MYRLKHIIFLIILLVIFPNLNYSQKIGSLRGLVSDSTSGEALPFCNILVKGTNLGTASDSKGHFVFASLKANQRYKIVVSYMGYNSKEVEVFIETNRLTTIKVLLSQQSIQMQTVEKIGERYVKKNELSIDRISAKELSLLPRGVEADVFRALQYTAGVRSTGDVSAKYYVRGGSSSQNLILLDGSTLYNPFHAFGIFSAIDPDIINSIEFYKGNFSPEFGGRLSSVLKLETKDGNLNKFSAKAAASMLTFKSLVEIPYKKGSILISGRKTHSTEILKKFMNDKNTPIDFYDLFFKVNYADSSFMENGKFTLFGFFTEDKLNNDNKFKEDYNWKTNLVGVRWFQMAKDLPLFYEINIYGTGYKAEVIPNNSNTKYQKNSITDFTMRLDFTYVMRSKDELKLGLHIKDIKNDYENKFPTGEIKTLGRNGSSIIFYGNYKLNRFEDIGFDFGTRLNLTRISSAAKGITVLEPRGNLYIKIWDNFTYKCSAGIFTQEFLSLVDENTVQTPFEPWMTTPSYLNSSQSNSIFSGFSYEPWDILSFDIEGYYKEMKNIPMVNDKVYSINENTLYSVDGEAYGIDAQTRLIIGDLLLNANYSLGWAQYNDNGKKYRAKFDSRHAVNLSADYNLGAGWNINIQWVYTSGRPFTQIMGYYDRLDTREFMNDLQFANYTKYMLLDEKNKGQLPDYHRMDINISKKINIWKLLITADFSIINLYNRANLFYFTRENQERVNMLPFLPTFNVKVEI